MISFVFRVGVLVIFMLPQLITAQDFGQVGAVFEIKEEGFVAMMQRKLSELDIDKYRKEMTDLAKDRVENPPPVRDLEQAERDREYYYDPTYVLPDDAKLPDGTILYKAGTSVNPLEHMKLERRMIFIDGRVSKQVEWLKDYLHEARNTNAEAKTNEEPLQNRIILTGGKIFDLQEELGEILYFDQAGELTGKFGIKFLPAVAMQENKYLKIKEFHIDK
jgi:conjugal transfer pilus assembly protein TraW